MEYSDIMKTISQAKAAAKGSQKTVAIHGGIAVEAPGIAALFKQQEILVPKGDGITIGNPRALTRILEMVPEARATEAANGFIEVTGPGMRFKLPGTREPEYRPRIRKTDQHVPVAYPGQMVDAITGAQPFLHQQVLLLEQHVVAISPTGAVAYTSKHGQTLEWPVAFTAGTVGKIREIWPKTPPEKGYLSPSSLLLSGSDAWVQFQALEDPEVGVISVPPVFRKTIEMVRSVQHQCEVSAMDLQQTVSMMAVVADVEDPAEEETKEEKKARESRAKVSSATFELSEGVLHVSTEGGENKLPVQMSGVVPKTRVNLRFLSDACKLLAKRSMSVYVGQMAGFSNPHLVLTSKDEATSILIAGMREG